MPTPHATRLVLPASALNMIVVSESSAEVTQLGRTRRYTPAGCRSSAARNDTPRYADARPISVHTEEHNLSKINNPVPPAGLAPGWPRAGHEGGGSPGGAGIPSCGKSTPSVCH
jgi:hypothetical protein